MKILQNTRIWTVWNLVQPTAFVVLLISSWKLFGFLAAHIFAEILAVSLATLAFLLAGISKRFLRQPQLLIIAGAFGWSALLNILHLLTYPGMGLLPVDELQVSTALRLGGALIESSAFLLAFATSRRAPKDLAYLVAFGIAALSVLALISQGLIPNLHIGVLQASPCKLTLESLVIVLLAVALILQWRNRQRLHRSANLLLALAVIFFIASQVAIIRHDDFFSLANIVSHGFKIVSYWFVYLALVESTLKEPFSELTAASRVYDTINEPLLIVDSSSTIVQANRAAGLALGVAPEMLIGRSDHALFHNADIDSNACAVCQAVETNQPLDRVQLHKKHGSSLIEISLREIPDSSASEPRYIEVIHDISDLHQARTRLQLSDETLMRALAAQRVVSSLLKRLAEPQPIDAEVLRSALDRTPKAFRLPHLIGYRFEFGDLVVGEDPPIAEQKLALSWETSGQPAVLEMFYRTDQIKATPVFDETESAVFNDIAAVLKLITARVSAAH